MTGRCNNKDLMLNSLNNLTTWQCVKQLKNNAIKTPGVLGFPESQDRGPILMQGTTKLLPARKCYETTRHWHTLELHKLILWEMLISSSFNPVAVISTLILPTTK